MSAESDLPLDMRLQEAMRLGKEAFTALMFLEILDRWKEGANPDRVYQLAKQIAADLVK